MKRSAPAAPRSCCAPGTHVRARNLRGYAGLFKALGDETRLEILGLLAAHESELCVCDVEGHFELSQPTISHHLRILRDAGFVDGEKRGTWTYYRLHPEALAALRRFLEAVEA
ncbi:MAG: winged helix-turn-helix transcriptional regulator [Planctomycetes bacterium]|nr:winged helix-turn-helix transcriptional regulator [Planctomycetota bacterium]